MTSEGLLAPRSCFLISPCCSFCRDFQSACSKICPTLESANGLEIEVDITSNQNPR